MYSDPAGVGQRWTYCTAPLGGWWWWEGPRLTLSECFLSVCDSLRLAVSCRQSGGVEVARSDLPASPHLLHPPSSSRLQSSSSPSPAATSTVLGESFYTQLVLEDVPCMEYIQATAMYSGWNIIPAAPSVMSDAKFLQLSLPFQNIEAAKFSEFSSLEACQ